MVESAAVALRLLELIALLFPVVALLLQLQHRKMDSNVQTTIGGLVGTGLTIMLSLSFVTVALSLVASLTLSSLLTASIVVVAFTALFVPVLVVLSLGQSFNFLSDIALVLRTKYRQIVCRVRQFYREIFKQQS